MHEMQLDHLVKDLSQFVASDFLKAEEAMKNVIDMAWRDMARAVKKRDTKKVKEMITAIEVSCKTMDAIIADCKKMNEGS